MRTCIRCHEKNIFDNRRVCSGCMKEWTDMRTSAYDFVESKVGKLTPETHETYKKEMKRLEKIWKKDKEQFNLEINENR